MIMFTRSGKRIHSSFHENFAIIDAMADVLSERKTRSRRLKENDIDLSVVKPKIRDNYVTYPTDDEQGPQSCAKENKPRNLRKNTLLKEFNFDSVIQNSKDEVMKEEGVDLDKGKVLMEVRKTKRFYVEKNNESHVEATEKDTSTNEKHKGKKTRKRKEKLQVDTNKTKNNDSGLVPDKKTKSKKKNKKNSITLNGDKVILKLEMNRSNTSIDSFHSAAGSPDKLSKGNAKEFDNTLTNSIENSNSSLNKLDTISNKTEIQNQSTTNDKTINTTYETSPKNDTLKPHDGTYDKISDTYKKINITFDKDSDNGKSSLISSDGSDSKEVTINVTFDKVAEDSLARISITSDESKGSSSNLLNSTPYLIESSEYTSELPNITPNKQINKDNNEATFNKSDITSPPALNREGTFTKDGPDPIIVTTKPKSSSDDVHTPSKRYSLPAPGNTPFHSHGKKQEKSTTLNLTHSIEKPTQSIVEQGQKSTKVMFCSPVDNNTCLLTQRKSKIIKSSMKGSNKSFVFEDNLRPGSRKRSFTQNDAEEIRVKRTRLAGEAQDSSNRLSRPRTSSAVVKSSDPTTPSKSTTPTSVSETKSVRRQLPNFAALHQRQFAKMESLDECQERKAKRAKQLLSPTGSLAVLERKNLKVPSATKTIAKPGTPVKCVQELPALDSSKPGYTRFGFKINCDVNPFSIPSKSEKTQAKSVQKVDKVIGLTRQASQPSLFGVTTQRKVVAKQTVLREKSSTCLKGKRDEKRNENRTIIKGVRTNRRFELQMRLRNVNA